ncbi:MAG: hypothetical protein KGZ39_08495 [Simkania sp.]|nr:hypothetical protein [Simkania sp.]
MESPKNTSFLERFILKIFCRNLRFDILTVFLFLLTISSISIIWFTYSRQSKAILDVSTTTIERVNSIIIEKLSCLTKDLQQIPSITGALIKQKNLISLENSSLPFFMFNTLRSVPSLAGLYITTPDGKELEATNLLALDISHYKTDLSIPLPEGCTYLLRKVDYTKNLLIETIDFKNEHLQTISSASSSNVQYDARSRPWYLGAVKTKMLYWTAAYKYYSTGELGITVSLPLYTSQGDLIAVIGADLPLTALSNFLAHQPIGNSGKAFILDSSGTLILPPLAEGKSTPISSEMLSFAYAQALKTSEKNFIFDFRGTPYLASMHLFPLDAKRFPLDGKNGWSILIIDPLSDFFSGVLKIQKEALIISCAILMVSSFFVFLLSNRIANPIVTLSKEIDKITRLDLDSKVRVHSNIKEIDLIDSSIFSMRNALRSFVKYMPKKVVKRLIEHNQEVAIGGEKKEITIFFSDITGFTSLAESLSAETTMSLLAEYFDVLSKTILVHEGTIDKYIGDGLMAFWGAPQEILNHPSQACISALLCQAEISQLNAFHQKEGKPALYTRIGINTGIAIIGNIGTSERMNYTAVGDAVNIAARLQPLNTLYHTSIIISETVKQHLGEQFLTRPLDISEVRGKTEKIKIYELVALLVGNPLILATPEQLDLCSTFTQAYEAFYSKNYNQARTLFQTILQRFPKDIATQLYLERLQNIQA